MFSKNKFKIKKQFVKYQHQKLKTILIKEAALSIQGLT